MGHANVLISNFYKVYHYLYKVHSLRWSDMYDWYFFIEQASKQSASNKTYNLTKPIWKKKNPSKSAYNLLRERKISFKRQQY